MDNAVFTSARAKNILASILLVVAASLAVTARAAESGIAFDRRGVLKPLMDTARHEAGNLPDAPASPASPGPMMRAWGNRGDCIAKALGLRFWGEQLTFEGALNLCSGVNSSSPADCFSRAIMVESIGQHLTADAAIGFCNSDISRRGGRGSCFEAAMRLRFWGEQLTFDGGLNLCRHAWSITPANCFYSAITAESLGQHLTADAAIELCRDARAL